MPGFLRKPAPIALELNIYLHVWSCEDCYGRTPNSILKLLGFNIYHLQNKRRECCFLSHGGQGFNIWSTARTWWQLLHWRVREQEEEVEQRASEWKISEMETWARTEASKSRFQLWNWAVQENLFWSNTTMFVYGHHTLKNYHNILRSNMSQPMLYEWHVFFSKTFKEYNCIMFRTWDVSLSLLHSCPPRLKMQHSLLLFWRWLCTTGFINLSK